MQATARSCSLGVSTRCGCGRLPNEPPADDFRWGGCGDDVNFGFSFSKTFLEQKPPRHGKISRVSYLKAHNQEVGRKVYHNLLHFDNKNRLLTK